MHNKSVFSLAAPMSYMALHTGLGFISRDLARQLEARQMEWKTRITTAGIYETFSVTPCVPLQVYSSPVSITPTPLYIPHHPPPPPILLIQLPGARNVFRSHVLDSALCYPRETAQGDWGRFTCNLSIILLQTYASSSIEWMVSEQVAYTYFFDGDTCLCPGLHLTTTTYVCRKITARSMMHQKLYGIIRKRFRIVHIACQSFLSFLLSSNEIVRKH